ncbi:hypothetical protein D3C81_1521000 [compost metagenome]
MVGQVQVGAVEVVGQERAPRATFGPTVDKHEVVDRQLAASGKQVGQVQGALGAFEYIVLLDLDPR